MAQVGPTRGKHAPVCLPACCLLCTTPASHCTPLTVLPPPHLCPVLLLCWPSLLQVRRNLHTYSPSQLVSVLSALASYAPGEGEPSSASGWHPGRLFLYDFITHSSPPGVVSAWSGRQAAQVLWAFSRFR